ncbi:kinetochore protein NDC80 homolog [Oppia nitens]|uniref:kinetochore protein NDC80 homolog n=1 Tax=Oppia nitens TaxID=1686743 RepID=UPI0023D9CA27|nr:kinetochore protein NDC80 homolog [Oppia nitens]
MNSRQSNFGFGGSGRPSGIRPPSSFGHQQSGNKRLPILSTTSSRTSIPSTASSRKMQPQSGLKHLFSAATSSGGSSRLSNAGAGGGGGARQSMLSNFRSNPLFSARKSVTSKMNLIGLTPQHNRPSYQPNTCSSAQSSRRSSIGGMRHVKDTRPLSDPKYQRECVEKLLEFLTTNPLGAYPHTISKTFATRPTNKEIANIFEFLFLCLGLKGKVLPMETEIPKMMAVLEYPFPVKKSDLVSFTSGRALGSVLGMLEWLVNTIQYGIDMDPIRTFYPNFEGEIDIKTRLVKLCLSSNAEEADDEQIDQNLQELLVDTYGTEDDYQKLVDESEALSDEIKRLDNEIETIKNLPQTIQTYESDIKAQEEYLEALKMHQKEKENEFETNEKKIEDKKDDIKKLEQQRKHLKNQVEEQAFGIEEAALARERKQQLEEEIKQEVGIIEEIKKSIRGARLERSKCEDTLKKMHSDLDSFITAMRDLIDSPAMTNYSVTLKRHLQSHEWSDILSTLDNLKTGEASGSDINELEKFFSHKVHELKIAIIQQLSSLQGSVTLTEQQKLNELNLLIEEKEKQYFENQKSIQNLMSEIEVQQKEQVSHKAGLQSECDRTRQMLSEIDGNTKMSDKEDKQNLNDLRKQVEDKENRYEREQKNMTEKIENQIAVNKKGIQTYATNLGKLVDKEKQKNKDLKKLLKK